jgi:hypothetical protein
LAIRRFPFLRGRHAERVDRAIRQHMGKPIFPWCRRIEQDQCSGSSIVLTNWSSENNVELFAMSAKLIKRIAIFGLIGALASCTVGKDFQRPAPASLTLGEMTKSQAMVRYGDPWQSGSQTTNGQSIEKIVYGYSGGGDPLVSGVTPARTLDLYFHKQVLVGYLFTSTFKSDHTDFDQSRVGLVKKGETCSKVSEVFGPSPGKAIYPMANERDLTVHMYTYPQTKGKMLGFDFYLKSFSVACDKNGNIVDVVYSESGER